VSQNETTKVVDPLEVFRLRSKLMNHLQSYRLTLSEEERHELDGKYYCLVFDCISDFDFVDAWGLSFNDIIQELNQTSIYKSQSLKHITFLVE